MSVHYFAWAAYGVVVEGDAREALEAGLDQAMTELEDTDGFGDLDASEQMDAALARFREQDAKGYARVLKLAGVPRDARLMWTDDPDDRPGTCYTDPEIWIAGYGVLEFPREVDETQFKKKPEWFMWVTFSC
jgi:hypothetical protein